MNKTSKNYAPTPKKKTSKNYTSKRPPKNKKTSKFMHMCTRPNIYDKNKIIYNK